MGRNFEFSGVVTSMRNATEREREGLEVRYQRELQRQPRDTGRNPSFRFMKLSFKTTFCSIRITCSGRPKYPFGRPKLSYKG